MEAKDWFEGIIWNSRFILDVYLGRQLCRYLWFRNSSTKLQTGLLSIAMSEAWGYRSILQKDIRHKHTFYTVQELFLCWLGLTLGWVSCYQHTSVLCYVHIILFELQLPSEISWVGDFRNFWQLYLPNYQKNLKNHQQTCGEISPKPSSLAVTSNVRWKRSRNQKIQTTSHAL